MQLIRNVIGDMLEIQVLVIVIKDDDFKQITFMYLQ